MTELQINANYLIVMVLTLIFRQITNLFAFQVPGGHGGPGGAPFKLNIVDSIERIKEEFNFLQAQYHK